MTPEITLTTIHKTNTKIVYDFCVTADLQRYFNPEEEFFIEYDCDITPVPDSILVIPFLCNVLPIAWVLNASVYAEEVDKSFYESIPNFKQGYIKMYPAVNFMGNLIVNKIIKNMNNQLPGKNLAFFSGGVDAFNTLINHYKEKPVLMTLWGSDVFFDDVQGWNNVKEHVISTAMHFGLEYICIKTNFRKFLNEGALSKFIIEKAGDEWWHGFQHGIGIIAHAAPAAYLYNTEVIYIASSYAWKDIGKVTCASDPAIDNHVRIANSKVVHDGCEFNRGEKIKNICDFAKRENCDIKLRVCYQSSGGKNCNRCEKCYRTTLGILAEGYNPNDFGLLYNKHHGRKIKNAITYKLPFSKIIISIWENIAERLALREDVLKNNPELKWILKVNFNTINKNPIKIVYRITRRFAGKLKRIVLKGHKEVYDIF
ncbi:hypothetical protein FACS1894142_1550 [Spirochaetia bacterium]|nr:hypothetical protein FACS1894142_1550 [Spirochaetia bacterium]